MSKFSEVKPIAWKDLHIVGADMPPAGWESFSGYRLGVGSFFDEIIYGSSGKSVLWG